MEVGLPDISGVTDKAHLNMIQGQQTKKGGWHAGDGEEAFLAERRNAEALCWAENKRIAGNPQFRIPQNN